MQKRLKIPVIGIHMYRIKKCPCRPLLQRLLKKRGKPAAMLFPTILATKIHRTVYG